MRFYTGVGSRSTPSVVQNIIYQAAGLLEDLGFTLRSGGAEGADQAFESGVREANKKEIYYAKDATAEAMAVAEAVHPNWSACTAYARSLHSRNVIQVLGADLKTKSEFLVCWTRDGLQIGGTRTAIVVAESNQIPVFNLGAKDGLPLFDEFLNKLLRSQVP